MIRAGCSDAWIAPDEKEDLLSLLAGRVLGRVHGRSLQPDDSIYRLATPHHLRLPAVFWLQHRANRSAAPRNTASRLAGWDHHPDLRANDADRRAPQHDPNASGGGNRLCTLRRPELLHATAGRHPVDVARRGAAGFPPAWCLYR